MTEQELREQLENIYKPLHEAQMEFTKKIIDAIHQAFEAGMEVQDKLK